LNGIVSNPGCLLQFFLNWNEAALKTDIEDVDSMFIFFDYQNIEDGKVGS
jgi:hypothetical protein